MRQALAAAGVDPKPYSGHSFRIGAATTAAKRHNQDAGMLEEFSLPNTERETGQCFKKASGVMAEFLSCFLLLCFFK